MSGADVSYAKRTLREFADVLAQHDLVAQRGVQVLWGAQARDFAPGVPTAVCVPTSDRFEPGGLAKHVFTALPPKIGPATKGLASVEVATECLWTREAGLDLVLYAVEPTTIDHFIEILINALTDLLGARGNWSLDGGRSDVRGGYSDLSDLYVLSISIKLGIFRLQRRHTAESVELTKEVSLDGPE